MKPVFADAFCYVACLNRPDQHHAKVMADEGSTDALMGDHPFEQAGFRGLSR